MQMTISPGDKARDLAAAAHAFERAAFTALRVADEQTHDEERLNYLRQALHLGRNAHTLWAGARSRAKGPEVTHLYNRRATDVLDMVSLVDDRIDRTCRESGTLPDLATRILEVAADE